MASPSVRPGSRSGFEEEPRFGRLYRGAGTPVVAADFALSAGFGSTASVAVRAGSTDERGHIDITLGGSGIAANPTVTLTFKDGPWQNAPFVNGISRSDSQSEAGYFGVDAAPTTTALVVKFIGTGVTAHVLGLDYSLVG